MNRKRSVTISYAFLPCSEPTPGFGLQILVQNTDHQVKHKKVLILTILIFNYNLSFLLIVFLFINYISDIVTLQMYVIAINASFYEDFHLIAFSGLQNISYLLTFSILLMYLLCMSGNLIIIMVVWAAPRLHTPMYFFLCNLSTLDMAYVSSILPKLLDFQITGKSGISFISCFTQLFMSIACVDTEFLLLSSMAFDRYVAICIPLKYTIIMNKRTCIILSLVPWTFGVLNSLLYVVLISHLSFCDFKDIIHFFCDMKALLRTSCSDIRHVNIVILSEGYTLGFIAFGMILISYVFIISAILKIKTSARRLKIFSSCSSHLTVVLLFCGSSLSVYMSPDSRNSTELEMMASLLYVAVVPALNPLVYSLRNKDVLDVLRISRIIY